MAVWEAERFADKQSIESMTNFQNSAAGLSALQSELGQLVMQEFSGQRAKYRKLWALPIAERVKRGKCIAGLRFLRRLEKGVFEFSVTDNNSDFREDEILLMTRGRPGVESGIMAKLYREEEGSIFLRLSDLNQVVTAEGEWVVDLNYIDLESTFLKAIEALGKTAIGRERVLPLLAGELPSQLDLAEFDNSCDAAVAAGYNDSQSEAIATAVATDVCCLIQGPPGTGKTRALAQVVEQLLERGERILVTSFTHRAIHNALNAIRAADPDCAAAKVGWPFYDPDLRVEQFEEFSKVPFARSGAGYVIGSTPFSLRSKRMGNVEFDTIIFDEASQVTLPLAIMAMLSGKKYIFFGDDQQLPPIFQTIEADQAHLYAIFSRLRGKGPEAMLTTSYRLNRELTQWPANMFYGGELRAHENNAGRRLPLQSVPHSHAEILDPDSPSVYVELPVGDARTRSLEEALLVVELLEEVHRCGISLGDVGVVTPFRRQSRQVRQLLSSRGHVPMEEVRRCTIDTVERMQGQERECVICSMTAADPDFIVRLRQFLFQPQRLNVTATRARSKFIMLASESLLTTECMNPDFEEQKAVLKALRDHSAVYKWSTVRGAREVEHSHDRASVEGVQWHG